jgi:5-methylcytosine-specific restriction protein A
MTRSTDNWRGATDDAKIPDRVKLRIWAREEGRCSITGLKIDARKDAYEWEHRIALCNGGRHSEDNIVLVLKAAHKAKTATDLKTRAKIDRLRKAEAGIKSKGRGFGNKTRKFDGTVSLSARARREEQTHD